MNWTKLSLSTTLAAALVVTPATAYADDPVPTVEQVVGIMQQLTDPARPAASKGDIVTPGFSPDEAETIDDHLDRMGRGGGCGPYIPARFVVTDIASAPNGFAGATLSVPKGRRSTPPGPIVLVDQGGHWLVTHDSAMTALDAFWYNATRPIMHGMSMSC
jgi:hypothetical protein